MTSEILQADSILHTQRKSIENESCYPRSGVVLDCIDSRYLPIFLLQCFIHIFSANFVKNQVKCARITITHVFFIAVDLMSKQLPPSPRPSRCSCMIKHV